MIKIIFKILVIFGLVVVELALVNKLAFYSAIPNIIIIIAIIFTLRGKFDEAVLFALIGGFLLDLASPLRFGYYVLFGLLIISLIHFFVLKFTPAPNLTMMFIIFCLSFILYDLLLFAAIKHLPAWQIVPGALIQGIWGLIINKIMIGLIKPKEEIEVV